MVRPISRILCNNSRSCRQAFIHTRSGEGAIPIRKGILVLKFAIYPPKVSSICLSYLTGFWRDRRCTSSPFCFYIAYAYCSLDWYLSRVVRMRQSSCQIEPNSTFNIQEYVDILWRLSQWVPGNGRAGTADLFGILDRFYRPCRSICLLFWIELSDNSCRKASCKCAKRDVVLFLPTIKQDVDHTNCLLGNEAGALETFWSIWAAIILDYLGRCWSKKTRKSISFVIRPKDWPSTYSPQDVPHMLVNSCLMSKMLLPGDVLEAPRMKSWRSRLVNDFDLMIWPRPWNGEKDSLNLVFAFILLLLLSFTYIMQSWNAASMRLITTCWWCGRSVENWSELPLMKQ